MAGAAVVPQPTRVLRPSRPNIHPGVPYQLNSVRLDAAELPMNAEIDPIERSAAPSWRSAVKVIFPVRSGRSALLKIVLDDQQPAPTGAIVRIEGDAPEFVVARRGEATTPLMLTTG